MDEKKAPVVEVCRKNDMSWREITPECIKNGFRKSGVNYYNSDEIVEMETDSDSTNIEVPDELAQLLEGFNINSGEVFDGFE